MNFFLCINGDAWMRFSSFWATNDHATKKEVQKAIAFPYEKTRVRTSTGTELLFANIKNWIDSKVAQNQSQGNDKERKRERKKEMPIKVKPCWIESLTFESYIQWHSWEYSVHTIISPFFTIDTVFSYLFSLKAEKTIFLLWYSDKNRICSLLSVLFEQLAFVCQTFHIFMRMKWQILSIDLNAKYHIIFNTNKKNLCKQTKIAFYILIRLFLNQNFLLSEDLLWKWNESNRNPWIVAMPWRSKNGNSSKCNIRFN